MEPRSEGKSKMQRHVTNIRRDARHKIVQQMRNQMYFQTQPIAKIAEGLGLAPKAVGEYDILEIMELCYERLLDVTKKMGELQGFNAIKEGFNLEAHINFWAFLLQQFYVQKLKLNESLEAFFIKFLHMNPYNELSKAKMLQFKVLNTLQIAMVPAKASQNFKTTSLKWITGTDGLTLIYNSLPNHFLCPNEFPNIYEVLKQCLTLPNHQKFTQTCQTLKYLLKTADYDDTYRIYTEQSDLMVNLLTGLTRYIEDCNVSAEADAVIYLMDSYNSLIFDYGRMGVGLLAVRLIICKREENVLKGLEILKFLSEVQETETMVFLLEDRELNDAGLWHTFFNTQQILLSQNISIKREGYTMLANIMSNGDYRCSEVLNKKINHFQQKQLIQLISYALKMEQDVTVLRNVLIMLSILLYYSQNYESDSQDENEDKNKRKDSSFHGQIERKIINLGLEEDVKKLLMHKNSELAESAGKLCESIEYALNPISTVQ